MSIIAWLEVTVVVPLLGLVAIEAGRTLKAIRKWEARENEARDERDSTAGPGNG